MLREETKEEEEEKEAMDATTKKTREEEQQQQQQQPLDDDDDARMIALGGDAKKVAWESDRWPSLATTGDEHDAKKFSEKNVEKVLGCAKIRKRKRWSFW